MEFIFTQYTHYLYFINARTFFMFGKFALKEDSVQSIERSRGQDDQEYFLFTYHWMLRRLCLYTFFIPHL
jgi:hypothetical protein